MSTFVAQNISLRKGLTILLLLIMLQYTFGLYAAYMYNIHVTKQNMHQAISAGLFKPQQVITITIPLKNLSSLEAERWQQHEIQYQGKMYDVVQTCQHAGNLIVQCICDNDENNLIASFLHTMEKHHRAPGKNTSGLQSLFSPFLLSSGINCPVSGLVVSARKHLPLHVAGMSKGFTYTPAPPPWLV